MLGGVNNIIVSKQQNSQDIDFGIALQGGFFLPVNINFGVNCTQHILSSLSCKEGQHKIKALLDKMYCLETYFLRYSIAF